MLNTRKYATLSHRRTSDRVLLASVGAFLLLIATGALHAQVGAADILGTVTDPSGAVVPNAQVAVKSLDTGAVRTMLTDSRGEYLVSLLPNGHYALQVRARGFATFSVTDITLSTGDRFRYDVKLATGSVTETMQVTAESGALQTDSSTVSDTVPGRDVQDLPLSDRNFVTAIQVQAGVNAGFGENPNGNPGVSSGTSPQDRRPFSTIVANGQSDQLNNQLIDGFDNNERSIGVIAVRPSLDGIAEIKVDTNSYSAEFGRTAGAVVNIVTKAGTNKFHGSAYEYFGNDIFDAEDYFATTKSELRMNDFGGSFGGPIKKDKTFFFGDVEDNRTVKGTSYVSTVPTAFERANPGNLSDVGGPTVTPSAIGLALFNLYPYPNLSGTSNNYSSSPRQTQFGATVDGRIDHHFSESNLFFARYAYNPVSTVIPDAFPTTSSGIAPGGNLLDYPGPSTTTAQNLQLDFVHIFSPNLLVDLKAAYTRIQIDSLTPNYGTGAAAKLGIPNVSIPSMPSTNVLPDFAIFSWSQLGDPISVPLFNTNNAFQYGGSVTYVRGSHDLRFGAGLIRRQVDINSNTEGGGIFVFVAAPPYFNDKANLLAGTPVVESRGNQLDQPGFRAWEPSFYAQDNWHMTAKLALNLGIRYDVFTPFTEAHGQYANFDPSTLTSGTGAQNFILGAQHPTIGVATDYSDVAPRVGFAYSLTPKTVLRGGFGLSYFPPDVGVPPQVGSITPASIVQNYNPPYDFSYTLQAPGAINLANGPVVPSAVDLSTYASNSNVTSLSVKAKNLRSSYVEQMNLFVQHQEGPYTITIGYVGVLGQQLLRTINLDQPEPPGAGNPTPSPIYSAQLPNVTNIIDNRNGAASNYNALQASFGRGFAHGLSFNANYTWAHALGDNAMSSDTNHPSVDYGNTNFDIRSRVAGTFVYELPFAQQAGGFRKLAIQGWQINGLVFWQTGLPFTVISEAAASNGNLYVNLPNLSEERPNQTGSAHLAHPSPKEWFNIDAFSPQTQGTNGNERVNQLVGPRDRRADLSLLKNFNFVKHSQLQFRAEYFNITNTPNFGIPNATSSSYVSGTNGTLVPAGSAQGATFGSISQSASNEVPRQFQFALKLLF
jgi:hypothetical protein